MDVEIKKSLYNITIKIICYSHLVLLCQITNQAASDSRRVRNDVIAMVLRQRLSTRRRDSTTNEEQYQLCYYK